MPELRHTVFAGEADPGALDKLVAAERIALGAVIALAILNLAVSFLPMTQQATVASLRPMSGEAVLFSLMSALSLIRTTQRGVRAAPDSPHSAMGASRWS